MIKVGIIGATGYAGVEIVRLLQQHKDAEVVWYGSRSYIDKKYADVFANMFEIVDEKCLDDNIEELADKVDVIFTATPQGLCSSLVNEEILNKVKASGTTSNEYKLSLKKASLKVEITTPIEPQTLLIKGNKIEFMTSIKNVSEQDMNDVIWEMSIPTGLEVMKSIGHNDFISTKDNSNDGETKSGATKILLGVLKAGETKYVTIELGVQEPAEEINIVSKVSAKNVPEHYSNCLLYTSPSPRDS